jgi:hypothetical protein
LTTRLYQNIPNKKGLIKINPYFVTY